MSRFEAGLIISQDCGPGIRAREPTFRCGHCSGHFEIRPGSGTIRGYCPNCDEITCGQPDCQECDRGSGHWERKLEILEGTRNPTAVSGIPYSPRLLLPFYKD